MVLAVGIYMTGAGADTVLLTDAGSTSVLDVADLRDVVRLATEAGCAPDRVAVAHPGWWDPWRVDRLLRDVRMAALPVDRYFTSAEAAMRWSRRTAGAPPDGLVRIHDVTAGVVHDTVVCLAGRVVEIVESGEGDVLAPAGAATMTVGAPGSALEHAVALGAALAVLGLPRSGH